MKKEPDAPKTTPPVRRPEKAADENNDPKSQADRLTEQLKKRIDLIEKLLKDLKG